MKGWLNTVRTRKLLKGRRHLNYISDFDVILSKMGLSQRTISKNYLSLKVVLLLHSFLVFTSCRYINKI